jgi:hypothetical protein
MLSIGERQSIKVTKANPYVTVGDNGYFSISGDGTNGRHRLSN